MYRPLLTFLGFFALLSAMGQSVLSEGPWYKMGLTESGIYKIDRSFISKLGVDPDAIDPGTIRIYGRATPGMLPQPNAISRANDPVELSIMGMGMSDGKWDNGDYFLFYGESADLLKLKTDGTVQYEKNLYSDTTYYFLTYGGKQGKRVPSRSSGTPAANPVTSYRDLIVHEKDDLSFKGTGRLWLESKFTTGVTQRTYTFDRPGILDSLNLDFHVVAESEGDCTFDVFYNEEPVGVLPMDSKLFGDDVEYADLGTETFKRLVAAVNDPSKLSIKLRFNQAVGAATSDAYLDYFILSFRRALALYGRETIFRTRAAGGLVSYHITDAPSSAKIWDLTDPLNPINQLHTLQSSGGIAFSLDDNAGNEFVVFDGTDFPAPKYFQELRNQNIKGLTRREAMIITYPGFLSEAERLADFHRDHDQMTVGVVTTRQIYNEFSGGSQDLTAIRDFLKYCYDQGGKLKYALLFGDASYDYKNRVSNNTNFVPVYESRESFDPVLSHSSDDFFGFFEEDEGQWLESSMSDHSMEIGIGRLPVTALQEASNVVDKIIRYKTSERTLDKWRNEIAYLADDGDGGTHMDHAEKLSAMLAVSNPEYNVHKIYLDGYEQRLTLPNSPQTTEVFLRTLKDGALVMNYVGHGNETTLTHEWVVTNAVLNKLTNRQKLPLFVTATCEFGRYDDPSQQSGAENLMLNPNGGAIALITTTRPVYAHTNLSLNQAFHANLFKKINGRHPRLGDIIKATKNESLEGAVNRNFALLGDPMLTLNYAAHHIIFDQLQFEDDTTGTKKDTLSALETYHLSGRVMTGGSVVNDFNGRGIVTLWDIPQEKVTKGQENGPFRYQEQTNALFRGEVSVENGVFDMEFVLPKNISYKYQSGKITMYAWDDEAFTDASGASRRLVLGGTAAVEADSEPPVISLYLNDPSFRRGGVVGPSSMLIARVSDKSGINISDNGFNQSIMLTLNNEEPIEINAFYTADIDDYTNGTILFPLQDLDPGKYNVSLKVWDTHNNPSTATVEFVVSDQPVVRLYNTKIYPNPVAVHNETTFTFEHDREGEKLEVEISVYNMKGSQVHNKRYTIDNSPRKIEDIRWQVSNYSGSQLERGIYLHRLRVTSTLDGASNEVVNRLVIIN